LSTASAIIHPIAAVLDNVNTIAAIRNAIMMVFRIAFLLLIRSLMDCHLLLHNTIIAGNNAMRKYQ
jgi:hypothetical protein